MKNNLSRFTLSIAAFVIALVSVTADAFGTASETSKGGEPQNDLIFNWVSSS